MQSVADPMREYRYERKYFIEDLDARQAIRLIKQHPALFSEIYPPRFINNIYFDSPLMDNYQDNVAGSPERKKARIRWYHDLFREVKSPILEFKIKQGLMGTKIQFPFPSFTFNKEISENRLKKSIRSSELPEDVRNYLLAAEPVLVNRYLRWYFATPDKNFRLTVDSGLTFLHLNKLQNHFLFRQKDFRVIVLELKYHQSIDPQAGRISSGFPFRVTRSSKYVQGIEKVYL
jgi:hypothetical protein